MKIARSAEIFEIALELVQQSVDDGILHKNHTMNHKYHFNGLVSPKHIRLLANLSGTLNDTKMLEKLPLIQIYAIVPIRRAWVQIPLQVEAFGLRSVTQKAVVTYFHNYIKGELIEIYIEKIGTPPR